MSERKQKSQDFAEVIAVLLMTPFTIVGHVLGIFTEAFVSGLAEGREAARALLLEVKQASQRRRAKAGRDQL